MEMRLAVWVRTEQVGSQQAVPGLGLQERR